MRLQAFRAYKLALALLLAVATIGAPRVLAADLTDIGFLDQGALANLPSFQNANKQMASFRANLQKQFMARARKARSQQDQARLSQDFQNQLSDEQGRLFGPLFRAAQTAVASVASSKQLSVVVDRRIIIIGGQDITKNVMDLLSSPGAPVPPVSSPPPSTVGWVDQTQIDQLDQFKSAQQQFLKFGQDEQHTVQDKLKGAKTQDDRNKIMADYQKTIDDQRAKIVTPLVDQTRSAIEGVAKKRGLVLVIDRSNLIFGGTDVTADVLAALKKS